MENIVIDYSSNEVQNALSKEFKKGDAMTYLKQLCAKVPREQIKEFTNYAMKSSYDYNRSKALDYMLALEGREEAFLLVQIHTQRMMFNEKDFEKGGKILAVICKHFNRKEIFEQLEICRNHKAYDQKVQDRHKELSYIVFRETIEEKNIKTKVSKI